MFFISQNNSDLVYVLTDRWKKIDDGTLGIKELLSWNRS